MDRKGVLLILSVFAFAGFTVAQSAGSGSETLRMTLAVSQVFLALLAIAGVSYSAYLLRGGMLSKPMAAVAAGLTVFAAERIWEGISTLGYLPPINPLMESLLYQIAGVLIAGGYIYVAFVLKN